MNQEINVDDLYSQPFSIARHKMVPYLELEVIISPKGEIEYALPSHQESLIRKAMEKQHWTRQELMDAYPPEFYFNFLEWLIEQSGGYIPVWERGITNHPVTQQQANALRKLKLAGLYRGVLPKGEKNG